MRLLLMIANSNMSVREMYGAVLRDRFPHWGVSHMSGLPQDPITIMMGYDALIYELGAPDDPKRRQALLDLWAKLQEARALPILTHIEGPYRDGIAADLENHGVFVVGVPFSPQTICEALGRLAPQSSTASERQGAGDRLRAFFGRKSGA